MITQAPINMASCNYVVLGQLTYVMNCPGLYILKMAKSSLLEFLAPLVACPAISATKPFRGPYVK